MKKFEIMVTNKFFALFAGLAFASLVSNAQVNDVLIINNQGYTTTDTLKADVFVPKNFQAQKNPILIFFSVGNFRKWPHYRDWANLAASQGFVSITYSAKHDNYKENFEALLKFAERISAQYNGDKERIAMYAASGPLMDGLPLANSNPAIKAAVMYYGMTTVKEYRTDLPVLLLRAGLDNIHLNKGLDSLAFRALQANAPYTIMNLSNYPHAFEDVKDPEAKRIMLASLEFLKLSMRAEQQESLRKDRAEIMAMRELYHERWREALTYLQEALKKDPDNNETERQIGNVYIELGEYRAALASFENAIKHGNWRKGEIAKKKIIAFAKLNDPDGAVAELKILRKINWFNESDYNSDDYKVLRASASYQKFLKEK